jgi:hypothetical protein
MRAHAPSILAALLLPTSLSAQTAPPPPPETPSPSADPQPAPTGLVLPALTPVRIEILETMNSATSRIGAHFPIRLASPIDIPGAGQVPAGAMGSGDVVHAAKSRFGGKPGELILAVRYLDADGVRIPLRSLTYGNARGLDNTDMAAAVNIAAGLVAVFITGGEVNIPAGTQANAKTSAPVTFPVPILQISAPSSQSEPGAPKP